MNLAGALQWIMGKEKLSRTVVPTIMQQEAVECGAACLGMILAHYGRWVSLEQLRQQCGVSRDGIKSTNILQVARSYGLAAKGLQKDIEDLHKLPFPMILFWSFNHFVVLESLDKDKAWINDPGTGRRSVTIEEFDEAFTGVVLAFQPKEEFVKGGVRPNFFKMMATDLVRFKPGMVYAVLAGIALLIPGIVSAAGYNIFIDHIMIQAERSWLLPLLLGLLCAGIISGVLTYNQKQTLARTETALSSETAVNYFWTVTKLPLTFFSQRYSGDIANRVLQTDRMAGLMISGFIPCITGLIPILGFGATLFLVDPVLAGLVATITALAIGLLVVSSRDLEEANQKSVNDDARLYGLTLQGLGMRENIRSTGTEKEFLYRFATAKSKVLNNEQKIRFRTTLINEGANFLMSISTIVVLIVGGLRIMDGILSIGLLLSAKALIGRFTGPTLGLVGAVTSLQALRGIKDRFHDAMNYADTHIENSNKTSLKPLTPADLSNVSAFRLKDFSYRYGPYMPYALEKINLQFAQGKRYALVGPSGSGKSTLGRFLAAIEDDFEGTFKVLGRDFSAWKREDLHKYIAYVGQETKLFEGTVKDNITLWDDSLPESQYIRAAQIAQIHDVITSRPSGYNARVLEGATNFSGGEQQRIALARALVMQPRILVLDEATSALDTLSEQLVMEAIRRCGITCVIIAHRLSTIMDCDEIIFMEDGKITAQDSHEKLIRLNEKYAQMVKGE